MNSHSSLVTTVSEILQVLNPTDDDWSRRFQVIKDLESVVQTLEILRGATVEPFGSFVSNLFTRWGDLDISIELPNGSYISTAGKKYKQTLLLDVLKALRTIGGFHRIKYISHARVPILKCESNKGNISCDISINNLSGQMKSKLLFWLTGIDARLRDMVLIVKEWAKAHNINDSKTGTLNSYSLSLLVIFHFQTCEPAILPPLSEVYPGNMAADLYGVRAVAEKNIEDICDVSINRIKSNRSRNINNSSLADLFISFLAKFSDINSRALTQGISPYSGQWEDIDTNMRWQPKTYSLFIEDPFEQPANCARSVGQRNLNKIAQVFQSSYQKLTSASQTHHLLAVLVRPEVLSIMSRSQLAGGSGIHAMNQSRIHPANPARVPRAPSGPHLQTYNVPKGPHLQTYNVPKGPHLQTYNVPNGPRLQNYNVPNGTHLQTYNVPNGTHLQTYNIPNGTHLQTYNVPNQYRNRNGGSWTQRGAHAPVQVQQQRYTYQNNPNKRVNQRPLQGGQSQSQSQVEAVSNSDAHKRNLNNGESSQNLQAQQMWRVRSEGNE